MEDRDYSVKNSSSKGLIAIIVVLVLVIIGMGAYIAYDKGLIFSKSSSSEPEQIKNEVEDGSQTVKNEMSVAEAMALGQELWNYAYGTYWSDKDVWKRHSEQSIGSPIVCDTTADEVKAKYTTDFKAESCPTDGTVSVTDCAIYNVSEFTQNSCYGSGRGALQNYMNTTLNVGTISEDEITFVATSNYCDSSFCHNGQVVSSTVTKDFVVKKVNGEWLISYFYLPN